MKIVVKLESDIDEPGTITRFAQTIASLFQDRHSLLIIHGTDGEYDGKIAGAGTYDPATAAGSLFGRVSAESRELVAALGRTGTPVLGICGGIGGMCDVRKRFLACNDPPVDVVQVDSRWIEVICGHRGVPVISNLLLAPWGAHCFVDGDRLAAACAKSWHADVLIYLTRVEGVRDLNGAIMRWLEINDIDSLQNRGHVTQGMLVKLQACKDALTCGVRRVRVFPVSHVESLRLFFSVRIDLGTEIIHCNASNSAVVPEVLCETASLP